jgi:predicted dehydrogenase
VRVVLSGLFGFGARLRAALERVEGAELLYGYHPDAARARAWDPVRGVARLEDALADPCVDAALIAAPTPHHRAQVEAALNAGKAVFVEKPVVSTYDECEAILRAWAARPSRAFMVGHNYRRHGAARRVAELLAEGVVGRVINVEMNWSHGGAFNFGMASWRGHARWHREGPLNTLGVHLFDLLHVWLGPVREVFAKIQNLAGVIEAPDCNAVLLEMESGATAFVKANYVMPSEERAVVYGTDGVIYVDRGALRLRRGRDVNRVPTPAEPVACPDVDGVVEELTEFARAVDAGASVETDLAVGVAAVCVLDACHRSAVEGRPVRLAEYPLYARAVAGKVA